MADNRNYGRRRSFFEDAIDDVLFPTYAIQLSTTPMLLIHLHDGFQSWARVEGSPPYRGWPTSLLQEMPVFVMADSRRHPTTATTTTSQTSVLATSNHSHVTAVHSLTSTPDASKASTTLLILSTQGTNTPLPYQHRVPVPLVKNGKRVGAPLNTSGRESTGFKNARFFLKIYSPNYKKNSSSSVKIIVVKKHARILVLYRHYSVSN